METPEVVAVGLSRLTMGAVGQSQPQFSETGLFDLNLVHIQNDCFL